MQISNSKSQNSSSKFNVEFADRLIRYTLQIVGLCEELREKRRLIAIADQLIRSGTSIGANVHEAKSAGTKKEYIRYFEIALKSANESKYWLILLKESLTDYNTVAERLLEETEQLAKILAKGIMTMKTKK